jgi:phage N-6-adenine-methyltransferase
VTELATVRDELPALAEARRAIDRARADKDADSLRDWRDKAEAIQHFHTRRGLARETADDAGEIRVRCEAALGAIDAELAPHGVTGERNSPILADVHGNTRANWRKLGALDGKLDGIIARLREDENAGVTTAHAVRVLRADALGVHTSSATPEWSTPQDLFDALNGEFRFTLDVCATPGLEKCKRFFAPEQDGLSQKWKGSCFMNPPYGSEIGDWVAKAAASADEGATVVCLVPARVDTAWWWDYCSFAEVRFLRGRLKFGGAEASAPFPSAVVIFGRPTKTVYWDWR